MLPDTPENSRLLAAEVIETTLSEVGRSFSETERTLAEIEAFADALASMMCAYLERLMAAPDKLPVRGNRFS